MSATARIVLLADHPSLHRGFATVARQIAGHLHQHTDWEIDYVGYYEPDPRWRSPGYRVTDLEAAGDEPALRRNRLHAWLAESLRRSAAPTLLLSIGHLGDLQATADVLRAIDPDRSIRRLAYTPIDYAPIPVQFWDVGEHFDAVIPYSEFARAALTDSARRAGRDPGRIGAAIAHGVDLEVFRPLAAGPRRRARASLFDLDEPTPLIGFFGRNSGHKRADIALHLFQALVHGRYARCADCGRINADAPDRAAQPRMRAAACRSCAGRRLSAGRPRRDLRLYLHTDLPPAATRRLSGGRDLPALAAHYDVEPQVLFNRAIGIGHGEPVQNLARRMAACDIHLLPYDCAGWELTVLETGACGVANVITDFATPPEYAAEFSLRVAPAHYRIGEDVRAVMDVDLGLAGLLRLLDDPLARRSLGERGPTAAARYAWPRICELWARRIQAHLAAAPRGRQP